MEGKVRALRLEAAEPVTPKSGFGGWVDEKKKQPRAAGSEGFQYTTFDNISVLEAFTETAKAL